MDLSRIPRSFFGESSQMDNSSPNEELKLCKAKCNKLQLDLEKMNQEKCDLRLQLMSAKTAKDQLFRNTEMEKQKLGVEHRAKLCSAQMAVENWKQKAEGIGNERKLLSEQYKLVVGQKIEAVSRLEVLQKESVIVRKHKGAVDIVSKNQKLALEQLQKRVEQLEMSTSQLTNQLETQGKDVDLMNALFASMESSKSDDMARISELENEVIELKATLAKERMHASMFSVQEKSTEALITRLRNENEELQKNVLELSESLSSSTDCNFLLKQLEVTYELVKSAAAPDTSKAKETYEHVKSATAPDTSEVDNPSAMDLGS